VSDAKVFIGDQVVVTVVSNVGRGFVYEANVSRDAFHTCRHDDEGVSLCGVPVPTVLGDALTQRAKELGVESFQ
jgi:hypothetical protein